VTQRILPRYLQQELLPPALLGLLFYTFILLMNLMFLVAELAIRQSLPLGLVLQVVALAIPRLLALTTPIAVLVGVMVGLSRLGSDGEIVALRALGVSDAPLYRAALGLGLIGWAIASALLLWAVPEANYAQHALAARTLLLSEPAREVQPRVFFEKLPGVLLYAEEVPAHGPLRRLFLYRAPTRPEEAEEMTLAQEARIEYVTSGDELTVEVDLEDGTSHAVDPSHPDGYQQTRFGSQLVRLPPAPALAARLRAMSEPPARGLHEQSLPELLRTISELDRLESPRARRLLAGEARMELYKQFALPCASLVFALMGVPLGLLNRRGARAASFAVSLGVILVYWILMTVGEDLLRKEVLSSPFFVTWAPNLFFLSIAALLSAPSVRRSLVLGGDAAVRWSLGLVRWRRRAASAPPAGEPQPVPAPHRPALRLISLLDRLVVSTFGRILLFLGLSAYMLYALVEFKGLIDDLLENHLPMALMWKYLRFRSPSILLDFVLPVSCLVAVLLAFAQLSRSGELTAMQASGVSRRRAALSVVVATALVGLLSLLTSETILPAANQRADELRDIIHGKTTPRTHYRPERSWVFGEHGRLYAYKRALHAGRILEGFDMMRIDRSTFRLAERWHAARATWDGSAWVLSDGWARFFTEDGSERFEVFKSRREAFGEDPDFLVQEWHAPEQMNFVELRRYVRDLTAGGYDVRELRVAMHERAMRPWVGLVMVLVALPFALRAGRQTSVTAIGLSLGLGMVYWALATAGTKLGQVGALNAAVGVWGPSLLFAAAGLGMLGWVRT
jgi:LPS export ABC transporter permease LptG/LPS export ABC transporter permease LptF